jgi:hypothetical protein
LRGDLVDDDKAGVMLAGGLRDPLGRPAAEREGDYRCRGKRRVAGENPDRPGAGQGGERSPGARRPRQQPDAETGGDQRRRMPPRQACDM